MVMTRMTDDDDYDDVDDDDDDYQHGCPPFSLYSPNDMFHMEIRAYHHPSSSSVTSHGIPALLGPSSLDTAYWTPRPQQLEYRILGSSALTACLAAYRCAQSESLSDANADVDADVDAYAHVAIYVDTDAGGGRRSGAA